MFAQNLLAGAQSGTSLFIFSASVGFAAALPLGPVSILSMQRAVTLGFRRAMGPSLGAIAANGLLGLIAALGSGIISGFILGHSFWFKLLGCVLLLAMGGKMLTLRPIDREMPREDFGPFQLFLLNFALVLSNPLTLAFFMAAFTFLSPLPGGSAPGRSMIAGAGVTLGVLVWFVLICLAAGLARRKVGDGFLNRARAGVGGLFVVVAVLSAASVLMAG